jgi:gamma-glutamyltranspeptidase / glutathione hydrolase
MLGRRDHLMKAFNITALLLAAALLSGCASTGSPPSPVKIEPITVQAKKRAVTTAHPLATTAALNILERGGSAVDAAIAAQMVLGLVEPQSSGVGGGALAMHWDAKAAQLTSFDGLSAAPSRVTAALAQDFDGKTLKSDDVARGGRSVGVPGALAVLKLLHERHGKLPWASLFEPAIKLAKEGFPFPSYMHTILSSPTAAKDHPEMLPLYFDASQKILPLGTMLTNPAYANTLTRMAQQGPAGYLAQGGAASLVAGLQRGAHPSMISEADLRAYRAEPREPLCAPFLAYKVCAMGPTSFGGVVVLQMLQMLEARLDGAAPAGRFSFDDPAFAHLYAEAGRLAQADRLHYIGDPAFSKVPSATLIAAPYLKERARLIDASKSAPTVSHGVIDAKTALLDTAPSSETMDATSQMAIVDADGNALSVTTTNNLNFGSRLLIDGYVLNNAMTNFASSPRPGQSSPNKMEPGKRPVTSMAPVIVFDATGKPVVVGGSAGGFQIVDYITGSLIEMIANQRTPAQALARGNLSTAVSGKVQLEKDTPAAALAPALAARGHSVEIVPLISGQGFLMRKEDGWIGAADPRRDGVAMGY